MLTMDPEPLVQPDRARAHGGRCRVPATSRVHRTPAAGRSRVAAAACVTAAAVAHARTVSNPGLFVPTVNRGVEAKPRGALPRENVGSTRCYTSQRAAVRKRSATSCTLHDGKLVGIIRAGFTCSATLAHVRCPILARADCGVMFDIGLEQPWKRGGKD